MPKHRHARYWTKVQPPSQGGWAAESVGACSASFCALLQIRSWFWQSQGLCSENLWSTQYFVLTTGDKGHLRAGFGSAENSDGRSAQNQFPDRLCYDCPRVVIIWNYRSKRTSGCRESYFVPGLRACRNLSQSTRKHSFLDWFLKSFCMSVIHNDYIRCDLVNVCNTP